MNLSFDSFGKLEEPNIYLAEVNKEIICKLPTTTASVTIKFNDISELSFTTPKFFDGYENEYYDLIEAPRQILVEGVGYFTLQHPKIVNNGFQEYRECTAYSTQCELIHKTVKNLIINTGETGSVDEVVFCDKDNWGKSLLHLILDAIPNWQVGYVDPLLAKQMRFFNIDSQDVYSLLTTNIAETFGCVFVFDTFNHNINAYYKESVGEMTDVCIRMDTLGKQVSIDYDPNQIKTAIYVYGSDNIDTRDCNMGLDKLVNLAYFHTVEWMGKELYEAWSNYNKKWQEKQELYSYLLQEYKKLLDDRENIKSSNPDEEIAWDSLSSILITKDLSNQKEKLAQLASLLDGVGSRRLEKWLSTYELVLSDQATLGYGVEHVDVSTGKLSTDEAYEYYYQAINQNYIDYLKTYNKILAIKFALEVRKTDIEDVTEKLEQLMKQMEEIANDLDWKNNFTVEQLKKLSYFIREDTYQDDNFVVTETMTDTEALEVRQALYEEGLKKLSELSSPSLEFTMEMSNILAIPEFQPICNSFNVGNYIYVDIRDDYQVKVRLLQINFDFKDYTNFSCIFGTATKYSDAIGSINQDFNQISSNLTSNSISESYWQKGGDAATEVDRLIAEGLNTALIEIKNSGNNQSITWDETGIHLRRWNYDRNTYEPEECWMVNDKILFSADNFQTAKSVFGRVHIGGEDRYVVIAEAMFAGLIEASMLVGNEITNGNGFYVDKEGNLTSTSGHIANWIICKDGLYHNGWATGLWSYYGNDTYTTDKKGNTIIDHHSQATVFEEKGELKTHYLAYWAGAESEEKLHEAPFRVYSDGCFFAVRGSMGGWTINDAGLYYDNYITGMWGKEEHENNLQVPAPDNDPVGGSSGIAIWAGNYHGYNGINHSPFMVTHDGHVYAQRGKIACFIINEDYLEAEDRSLGFGLKDKTDDNGWALWIGWNGIAGENKAAFKVGIQGDITFGHSQGHDMVLKVEQDQPIILNFIDQGQGSKSVLAYENNQGYWWRLGDTITGLYPAATLSTDLGSANYLFRNLYLKGIACYGDIVAREINLSNDETGTAVGKEKSIYVYSSLDGFYKGQNIKEYMLATFATKAELESVKNSIPSEPVE